MDNIQKCIEIIEQSDNIVFFGGAGVSTESGIPDFRSTDGLYNQEYKWKPETILSHSFYMRNKKDFFEFYRNKMICKEAKPNITHYKLAELEMKGKIKAVITQNIDGLHQMAGSKEVLELHGSVHRNYCCNCNKFYDSSYILDSSGIPFCECGGDIKPDVVLYEEGLNDDIISKVIDYISKADVLIVGGTSLSVYPAAGLIQYYKGNKLILINKTATQYDYKADLLIKSSLGNIFTIL